MLSYILNKIVRLVITSKVLNYFVRLSGRYRIVSIFVVERMSNADNYYYMADWYCSSLVSNQVLVQTLCFGISV